MKREGHFDGLAVFDEELFGERHVKADCVAWDGQKVVVVLTWLVEKERLYGWMLSQGFRRRLIDLTRERCRFLLFEFLSLTQSGL